MRIRQSMNDNWRFHQGDISVQFPRDKGPVYAQAKTERYRVGPASRTHPDIPDNYAPGSLYPAESWQYVRLPHDYVVWGTPDPKENNARGYLKYDNAWYRKRFSLSEDDRACRLVLEFEGIAGYAAVYFNGCLMKHNFCGYTSFEVDITDYALFGEENVIAVYVNTSEHEGWWYEGGGIYRNVWLRKTARIAVDTDGVYLEPKKLDDTRWQVKVETTVYSIAEEAETAELETKLLDPAGKTVATAGGQVTALPCQGSTAVYTFTVDSPALWDVDDPNLYTAVTEVKCGGVLLDTYTTRTGFRYFTCDPQKGFFLNGRHVKIHGVCAHEDCGLLGKAVPANVHRYKMELLKQMGANGYRTAHYQQNAAILDAADELGFIVLNEARWFASTEEGVSQLRTLVKRDRNRPSVFFWSLSNEEYFHLTQQGKRITRSLCHALRQLDPVRPITSAVDKSPNRATVFEALDIVGVNYNLGLYDEIHEKYPEKAIFSSENCATGTSRGWYGPDCEARGYLSAWDKDTNAWFLSRERTWKFIMERPWVMGGYQWAGFEHRGETVWPRLCSQSGAIDLFLQKKDAFYQNQSHWQEAPMIHVLPHWNVDFYDDEPVTVRAYTNCEEAELFLNGKSLGRQAVPPYTQLTWQVPAERGRLEAVGYRSGLEAAREVTETTGEAVALKLRLENRVKTAEDVAVITCYAVDGSGRFVPDAQPVVEFATSPLGRILSTGSDISDHTPLGSPIRKMRAGLISVTVGVSVLKGIPTAREGVIEVYAKAEGMIPARLRYEITDAR